jgi:hypothetical protein
MKTTQQDADLFSNWITRSRFTILRSQPTKHELAQVQALLKSGKTTITNRGKTYNVVKGWIERRHWHYNIQITDSTSCKLIEYTPNYHD